MNLIVPDRSTCEDACPTRAGWCGVGCGRLLLMVTLLLFVEGLTECGSLYAGEIRLKNGIILKGDLFQMRSITDHPERANRKLRVPQPGEKLTRDEDRDPDPKSILLVTTGWQKYYVSQRNIPPQELNNDVTIKPVSYEFKHLPANRSKHILGVGSLSVVKPFDEFGRRTVKLATADGSVDVIQGISRIEPDHIILEGLTHHWQAGQSLRVVPPEMLFKILSKKVDREDIRSRMALVSFYQQAEYYPQAFIELEGIERDFPDQKERIEDIRPELMNQFGRDILKELSRRKASGQHKVAEDFGQRLNGQQLTGVVQADVKSFLRDYETARADIAKAKNLLSNWQAKVDNVALVNQLQPLRSELNEQLDVETLPRLDAFLKAEADQQYSASQRLALAYSGWVLGAAQAITDLEQAVRLWNARFLILEFLRTDIPQERDKLLEKLRQVEGVGPNTILQLIPLLPPPVDSDEIAPDGIAPGQPTRIRVTPEGQTPELAYSVTLPPEYSPHRLYPVVVALGPRGQTSLDTARWWSGDGEQPGATQRFGYILIAPEYADPKLSSYGYGVASHRAVIDSLRDARLRFAIDADRVFLVGHGPGADAAFDIGMAHPDEFAGVIPIGGHCDQYPKYTYENGRYTSWYVIGGSYFGAVRDPAPVGIMDNMLNRGHLYDLIYVEYMGRGLDGYHDELPKLFEWMDLHRRKPLPLEVDMESLRQSENRFFWVTALDLPRTTILPVPKGTGMSLNPMKVSAVLHSNKELAAKATTPMEVKQNIVITGAADHYLIRLYAGLIDPNTRVTVRIKGRQRFSNFIVPDIGSMLDELRTTGDRQRIPLTTLNY